MVLTKPPMANASTPMSNSRLRFINFSFSNAKSGGKAKAYHVFHVLWLPYRDYRSQSGSHAKRRPHHRLVLYMDQGVGDGPFTDQPAHQFADVAKRLLQNPAANRLRNSDHGGGENGDLHGPQPPVKPQKSAHGGDEFHITTANRAQLEKT